MSAFAYIHAIESDQANVHQGHNNRLVSFRLSETTSASIAYTGRVFSQSLMNIKGHT